MPTVDAISSPANPLLKDIRRAVARGTLTEGGYCVAEGFHLLEEAMRSGCEVHAVLGTEAALRAAGKRLMHGARVAVLPEAVFDQLSSTETPRGVLALVRPPRWEFRDLLGGRALLVALDGVQDPGNAGTIARTAEAFGATGMCFLKGAVSPFNAKTLRASAGSLFRLPFVHGLDPAALLASFPHDRYAAVSDAAALRIAGADLTKPCALIVGGEGAGVSPALRSACTAVTIPTRGVESLNAAVAAAVLLYEAQRQREART